MDRREYRDKRLRPTQDKRLRPTQDKGSRPSPDEQIKDERTKDTHSR